MSGLPNAILRCASWLVPGERRAEWLEEWHAELCYLPRAQERLRFCFGAVPDAWWIWRNVPRSPDRWARRITSPLHCLLLLAALAGVSVLLAFRLPSARALWLPFPYPNAAKLAMIAAPGHFGEPLPTVRVEDYRLIANRLPSAFYRPMKARVSTERGQMVKMPVAWASSNLFEMLGMAISTAEPALVLRESVARKLGGGVLEVNGRKIPVAAVIPDDFWRLPGRADAWLIDSKVPAGTLGFVLGRATEPQKSWRWDLFVPNDEGGRRRFECTALEHQLPVGANLFVMGIALMMAAILVPRGDYPFGTPSPRRWIFLAVKTALVLPTVYFGAFDLASLTVMGFQPHAMLIGYILAFRWVLADQRQRCPVCLRLLTNPTRIGKPSQTFLELWGTEFMCGQGHGLLQVPEIPSSSTSAHRWETLEESWSNLFSHGTLGLRPPG